MVSICIFSLLCQSCSAEEEEEEGEEEEEKEEEVIKLCMPLTKTNFQQRII